MISPSKFSKIPRWCRTQPPPTPASCIDGNSRVNSAATLPPIYSNLQFIEPCGEPPALELIALQAVWKVQAEQRDVENRFTESVALTQHLKEKLKETKEEIEKISRQLNSPDYFLDESPGEGEQNAVTLLGKQNCILQQSLLEAINKEEQLTQDLQNAQRHLWAASGTKNLFSTEIESKVAPIMDAYETRMEFMMQKRFYREKVLAENASRLRMQTALVAKKTLKASEDEKAANKALTSRRIIGAKIARRRIEHHLKKTFQTLKETKMNDSCDKQMKQDKQHGLLSHLKKEIEEQREELKATNEARQERLEKVAQKKEIIHQELRMFGKNPYYVEHLLQIEKKRNQMHKTLLKRETDRLTQLQKDYEVIEKAKKADEFRKKKWEKFWVRNLEMKKRAKMLQESKMFEYDSPEDSEVTESMAHEEPIPSAATSVASNESILQKPKSEKNENKKPRIVPQVVVTADPDDFEQNSEYLGESASESTHNKLEGKRRTATRKSLKVRQSMNNKDRKSVNSGRKSANSRKSVKSRKSKRKSRTSRAYSDFEETLGEDAPKKNFKDSATSVVSELKILDAWADNTEADHKQKHPQSPAKVITPISKPASFRWQPESIIFSDYEVGRTYKKTLSITNVSIHRVKILFKEFQNIPVKENPKDETHQHSYQRFIPKPPIVPLVINDVVKIKNGLSATLSPGIQRDVILTFTPLAQQDFKGFLMFESPAESFKVLVDCRQPRFEPEITPLKVVFENVVSKTSSFLKVKITNKGSKAGVLTQINQAFPIVTYFGEEQHHKDEKISDSENEQDSNVLITRASVSHLELSDHHESGRSSSPSSHSRSKSTSDLHKHSKKTRSKSKQQQPLAANPQEIRSLLDGIVDHVTSSVFFAYVKECNRTIGPRESRNMVIFFRPPSIDTFRTKIGLCFDDNADKMITVNVEGKSSENPISVDPLTSDLKICTIGNNYQQVLSVSTSARGSGKVTPKVPEDLRQFVEIFPQKATVFPNNPGRFALKFHPTAQILNPNNTVSSYIDKTSNIIDFPIHFHLKFQYNVQTPISATIMAILDKPELGFNPLEIEMGLCSSVETVVNTFNVINKSMLPQKIGFVGVPQCISIQPNFGFATLLPFEERKFDILLSLSEGTPPGEYVYSIQCQDMQKRAYYLTVIAAAKAGNVQLSATKLLFPATAVGNFAFSTIHILAKGRQNLFDRDRIEFKFSIDPDYPITITPKAGHIDKNHRNVKILIRYEAKLPEAQVKNHLLEIMEKEHVQNQAILQRELDGINQNLEMEMVFGEEDLDPDFLRLMAAHKSKLEFDDGVVMLKKASNIIGDLQKPKKSKTLTSKTKLRKSELESKTKARISQAIEESQEIIQNPKKKNSRETFLSDLYKALELRRDELSKLLSSPFTPPDLDQLDIHTKDFAKAKQELMKRVSTTGHNYSIPCFVKYAEEDVDVLYLKIKAVVTPPSLLVLNDTNTIDFGSVVLGAKAYKDVYLYNITSNHITIKAEVLSPMGPFIQCNALRKVHSDSVYPLKFRMSPTGTQEFSETIKVKGGESQIIFTLRGKGIAPDYSIVPKKKDIYIGSSTVGNFLYQKFEITNRCEGELQFTVGVTNQGYYGGFEDLTEEAIISRFGDLQNENLQNVEIEPTLQPPNTTSKDTRAVRKNKSMSKKKKTIVEGVSSNAIIDLPSKQNRKQSNSRSSVISPPPVPSFSIKLDKNKDKLTNLNTNELVSFLQEKKEQFFFQSIPSKVLVPASSSSAFFVYLVPIEGGRFYADLNIKLFDTVVHEFSIVGIGHNITSEVRGEEA